MADKDLNDLFLDTLKDIYYAEKQILKSLPKMAKAATSDKLRAALEKHEGETEVQIERLEQIFELLGKPARGKFIERCVQDRPAPLGAALGPRAGAAGRSGGAGSFALGAGGSRGRAGWMWGPGHRSIPLGQYY